MLLFIKKLETTVCDGLCLLRLASTALALVNNRFHFRLVEHRTYSRLHPSLATLAAVSTAMLPALHAHLKLSLPTHAGT